jgi:hypothetical protein
MSPRTACTLAYAAALAGCVAVLAIFGPLQRRVAMTGGDDLSKIWAGPRAMLLSFDPYDPATWYQTAVSLGTFPPDTAVYLYPPWVAVALLPLAVLPLPVATILWTAGGLAAAAASLRVLCATFLPDRPPMHAAAATTLLLSGPAISTLLTGQWTFVLVAALSAVLVLLSRGRATAAGIAALAMLAKPQLFAVALPALAVRALWPAPDRAHVADRRALVIGAGVAAGLVGVSWLVLPSWWPAWPSYIGQAELQPEHVTLPGLLVRIMGDAGSAIGALAIAGALGVGLLFHPRGPAWLPIWLTASVVAAPYANPYDLLVLIVPLIAAVGALADRPRRAAFVFYAGTAILLFGATLLHDLGQLTYAPLVPVAMFVLLAATLWYRRASVGP